MFTADEDVANAVQPHPHLPVLATSGIESTVKVGSGHLAFVGACMHVHRAGTFGPCSVAWHLPAAA